jgi:flavin reductase (DIM6/NTAB) family NADH-FMN oxidoreductase RutF
MSGPGPDITGPIPAGREPDTYDRLRRRVLWSLPTGLYILGSRAGRRRNLMTVSWVTQVAQTPKLVGVGVERVARTHELIVDGGAFALNLLARRDRALVRRFVKPVQDIDVDVDDDSGVGTMNGASVHTAATGAPILDTAAAWLDCELRHTLPLGSHTWFVGEVVDVGVTEEDPGSEEATDPDAGAILRMQDTRMNYGG